MATHTRVQPSLRIALPLLVYGAAWTPTLRPGSASLSPLRPDSAESFEVRRIRAGVDSAPHLLARMTVLADAVPGDSDALTLITAWSAPVSSVDSLVVDRRSFAPRAEALVSPRLTFHYRYDGPRVTGSIQHGDSTPRTIVRAFDGPVFGFNQVESLVRSLRAVPGATFVVSLFSEADGAEERDTLTLVSDTVVAGRPAWIVRFADPVITQRYLVDAVSHRTLRLTTRQRQSGTIFEAVRE